MRTVLVVLITIQEPHWICGKLLRCHAHPLPPCIACVRRSDSKVVRGRGPGGAPLRPKAPLWFDRWQVLLEDLTSLRTPGREHKKMKSFGLWSLVAKVSFVKIDINFDISKRLFC